ncbi:MAG: response regulator [Hyphomicrobiales bacterium]|nr:response regulator [Hyphomicrobiales bacterium]MDE2115401.1 response regulator [Hyphomicrobiales bacterium]
MSISQAISPHLPYLRRFARSICGSQPAGDAYAVATLETILADPSAFDAAIEPRIALYKALFRVWSSVSFNTDEPLAAKGNGNLQVVGLERLAILTPRPRVAFLLSAVEGFSGAQIAAILDCPTPEAEALVTEASQELADQIAADVLIIEDEPMIAMDIETLVESLGHRVTEVARTRSEALAASDRHPPGLILADIQLADGSSGLEAVNEIIKTHNVPVIFITAYPERLLTGERPEPTFLITKPFRTEMVKAVISQALFFNQKPKLKTA